MHPKVNSEKPYIPRIKQQKNAIFWKSELSKNFPSAGIHELKTIYEIDMVFLRKLFSGTFSEEKIFNNYSQNIEKKILSTAIA